MYLHCKCVASKDLSQGSPAPNPGTGHRSTACQATQTSGSRQHVKPCPFQSTAKPPSMEPVPWCPKGWGLLAQAMIGGGEGDCRRRDVLVYGCKKEKKKLVVSIQTNIL